MELSLADGRLHYRCAIGALSFDLRRRLQARRADLALMLELEQLVEDVAEERTWAAERGLLRSEHGTADEFRRRALAAAAAEPQRALAAARRHYAACVACELLPVASP